MLYAELHGKLDDKASGLERREDILTSTVFGTLLVAGATKVLVDWLKSSRCLAGIPERLDRHKRKLRLPYEEPEYWFWPSLSYAQPDIMLRIGLHLLIVEAKYGSPKGILATDSESAEPDAYADESDPDQIVREWLSVQPNARGLDWYPTEIRAAIESCDRNIHVIYLVSTRKERTAVRELSEARAKISKKAGSDVPLWLLTWQELHRVLADLIATGRSRPTWTDDLRELLERRYLNAFLGFPRTLANFDRHRLDQLHLTAGMSETWAASLKDFDRDYFTMLQQVNFDAISRVAKHWPKLCGFCDA